MRNNKYKVSPADQRRFNGRTYGSKAEMAYAKLLFNDRLECLVLDYVEQPRLWLGVPENIYVPDFLVIPCDISQVHAQAQLNATPCQPYYVDVKGMETQKFKRDKKLWRSYGHLQLHIVKASGKKFKTTEVIEGGQQIKPIE